MAAPCGNKNRLAAAVFDIRSTVGYNHQYQVKSLPSRYTLLTDDRHDTLSEGASVRVPLRRKLCINWLFGGGSFGGFFLIWLDLFALDSHL